MRTVGVLSTLVLAVAVEVLAQSSSGPNRNVCDYLIDNNTPGFIKQAIDLGSADPTTVISVTVWLNLHNEPQLDRLVQQQYQKGSPSFQKWITQDGFNASFSPTTQEVKSVQNFLTSPGLSVVAAAESNFYVKVTGSVA